MGGTENTTVNLTRNRFGIVAVEMINVTCPLINYIQVIGYDIESDRSIGFLAIHGKLSFNTRSMLCSPINHKVESALSKQLRLHTNRYPVCCHHNTTFNRCYNNTGCCDSSNCYNYDHDHHHYHCIINKKVSASKISQWLV